MLLARSGAQAIFESIRGVVIASKLSDGALEPRVILFQFSPAAGAIQWAVGATLISFCAVSALGSSLRFFVRLVCARRFLLSVVVNSRPRRVCAGLGGPFDSDFLGYFMCFWRFPWSRVRVGLTGESHHGGDSENGPASNNHGIGLRLQARAWMKRGRRSVSRTGKRTIHLRSIETVSARLRMEVPVMTAPGSN